MTRDCVFSCSADSPAWVAVLARFGNELLGSQRAEGQKILNPSVTYRAEGSKAVL